MTLFSLLLKKISAIVSVYNVTIRVRKEGYFEHSISLSKLTLSGREGLVGLANGGLSIFVERFWFHQLAMLAS